MQTVARYKKNLPRPKNLSLTIQSQPRQGAAFLSWFFLGGTVFLSWITGLDGKAPWLPFFVSIFILGLPHGAADWILLRPVSKRSAVHLFLLYSLAGAAIALLAWLFPLPVILGFLLLSILHFGIADERDLRSFEFSPSASSRGLLFRYGGIARVAVFLALICYLRPEGVAQLFGRVGSLLGSDAVERTLLEYLRATSLPFLVAASIAWALSLTGTIMRRVRGGFLPIRKERFEVEMGEGLFLVGTAIALDSMFAVGAYFLCWHATKHCLLISQFFPESANQPVRLAKSLLNLHLRSWPLYLPVIPLMFGLVATNGSLLSPLDWVASLLVVCVIFTLPHHGIVEKKLPFNRDCGTDESNLTRGETSPG